MTTRSDKSKPAKSKAGGAGHPSRRSSPSRLQSTLDALKHSEGFLLSLIEQSPHAMWISNSQGTLIKMNQACRDLLNVTDEELVGKYNVLQDNIVEQQGFMPLVRDVFAQGSIAKFKLKYDSSQLKSVKLQRSAYVILEVTISPIIDAEGKVTNAVIQHVDITEREMAEEALKASEAQYRLLSEHTTDTVAIADMNLKTIYISPSVEKLRGFTAKEIMQMPLEKQVTPESLKAASEVFLSELPLVEADPNYNPILTLEFEYSCKKGGTVWMENKFSVLRDDNNVAVGILAEGRDITERRQTMAALRESEELYRSLFENMMNGFAYCKMIFEHGQPRDFTYLAVNKAFEKQTGLKDITGKKVSEAIPGIYENDPQLFEIYGRVALTGIPEQFETYVSALQMWFSVSVYSPQKEYFVAVFDVITERKLAEEKLVKSYESLKKTLNDAISTMVKIVELRDPYTAGHQQNVASLATAIAGEMKLQSDRVDHVRMAAVIHDIGKMYIPTDILSKPGKLTYIEYDLIKTHPKYGYDIVIGMDFPTVVAQAILQHHERLDGSGYPGKLKGEDMLLEAKILVVADVVEAMASHRPYRSAMGIDKALEEISMNNGKLYDPAVVDACLELFRSGRFAFVTA
ncbi:MAG: HD domain-containing phosphohydrolase [Dehalococcoidia bacterium]|jgi:HD-GYP domain-containing protein (c-di-GMP phosphodiesterase class II)